LRPQVQRLLAAEPARGARARRGAAALDAADGPGQQHGGRRRDADDQYGLHDQPGDVQDVPDYLV
jgi:hypothetical protein